MWPKVGDGHGDPENLRLPVALVLRRYPAGGQASWTYGAQVSNPCLLYTNSSVFCLAICIQTTRILHIPRKLNAVFSLESILPMLQDVGEY